MKSALDIECLQLNGYSCFVNAYQIVLPLKNESLNSTYNLFHQLQNAKYFFYPQNLPKTIDWIFYND